MDVITLSMAKAYTDSKGGYLGTKTEVLYENAVSDYDIAAGQVAEAIIANAEDAVILEVGKMYSVTFNGVKYKCECHTHGHAIQKAVAIGNSRVVNSSGNDTGEPFVIIYTTRSGSSYCNAFGWTTGNEASFTIEQEVKAIIPIDPKYIPTMDNLTINGVDGKQYKLTVDENGALVTTAVV